MKTARALVGLVGGAFFLTFAVIVVWLLFGAIAAAVVGVIGGLAVIGAAFDSAEQSGPAPAGRKQSR